jgi:hypothetical protein
MAVIYELHPGKAVMRKRPTRYTPDMASPSDLRKLRALYEGDPAEAFQREQARQLEAAARRMAARLD